MALQLRRGTAAQWTSANPVLASGEPGFETDTGFFKIGNGSSAWSALAYASSGGGGGGAITTGIPKYTSGTASQAVAGTDYVVPNGTSTPSGVQTLTGTRIVKRVITLTNGATPALNTDLCDIFLVQNLNVAITSLSKGTDSPAGALTGTPTAGQQIIGRIRDNGTARAITLGPAWRLVGVTFPTSTVPNKLLYFGAMWNVTDAVWDVLAVGQEV